MSCSLRHPTRTMPAVLLFLASTAGSISTACSGRHDRGLHAVDLRCEYRRDPLGVDETQPRLSWALESAGREQRQSSYRVIVASSRELLDGDRGDLWDTGRIDSDQSVNLEYAGRPLTSGERCVWKVMVWDRTGEPSAWSDPAWWETAILEAGEWTGDWIGDGRSDPERDEDFYREDPAPLFRKSFRVERPVRSARLYISGLGYYEAYLNGERVGDQVLDPGWTDYRDRIFYSTYDVTPLLTRGENALGAMLGNGWYNPLPLLMWGGRNIREALPTGRPRFIARLDIRFEDGSSLDVVTDGSWRTRPGPILKNNIYLGEVYDARRETDGWCEPDFDDSGWARAAVMPEPGGRLTAQPQPPIRITEELAPVAITEPEPGVWIFDFGRNFAGWVRLRLRAEAGTAVKLRFAELLNPDGTLNPMTSVCGQIKGQRRDGTNIGGPGSPEIAWQEDTYIARGGGVETYTPRFTFHAFRYVEVTGYPGEPGLSDLTGLRLNTEVGEAGSFTCSNDLLNRIQEMVRWTFLSNLFSVQSDCPHRERFGYGGDLVVTSDAFMLNFDLATFYAKSVRDWHDAALPDGMLTDTAPFVGIQYCGVGWAMAHPHLLDQLYRYYGDRRLLQEQYPTAGRWLDLVTAQSDGPIMREGLSDHEGLEPAPSPAMVTPLYYESARLLSRLASVLGRTDDTERYAELAGSIREAYLAAFLEPGTGRFSPATQASQAFALALGLAPPEEREPAVRYLVEKIRNEHEGHLATGIFGTRYLLEVLSETGHADLAYEIATQDSFPGWGYMLASGATTLWEHWAESDNTYSHNHPMFGSVSAWFFRWLAGIQPAPEAEAFDRILLRPQPAGDLAWVTARVNTIRGRIESRWRRRGDRFTLHLTVPPNTEAVLHLPAREPDGVRESGRPVRSSPGVTLLGFADGVATYRLGSGRFSFRSRLTPEP